MPNDKKKLSAGDILLKKLLEEEIAKLVNRYKEVTGAIDPFPFRINHKPVNIPPLTVYKTTSADRMKMIINRAFKVGAAIAIPLLGAAAAGVPIPAIVLQIGAAAIALAAGEKAIKETVKARNGGKQVKTGLTDIISSIFKLITMVYNYIKERRRK